MENKINIVELLKDCPKGMELDCTMFERIEFDSILDSESLPICCRIKNPHGGYTFYNFTKYGCLFDAPFTKCVIFPKGKTTWEGFVPPCKFKDGNILYVDANDHGDDDDIHKYVFILKEMVENKIIAHCYISDDYLSLHETYLLDDIYPIRFATEDEKKKLFDAIRKNGYKWDSESKTLKKIEPRFKVGDRIKCAYNNNQYDIKELTNTHYILVEVKTKFKYNEPIINDKDWVLVPNKFDITTLKPFESKVLVRGSESEKWKPAIWGYYDSDNTYDYPYEVVGGLGFSMCIPYEENKHLSGNTDDCDEYYKTWE